MKWVRLLPLVACACSEVPVHVIELAPNTLSQELIAHYRFDDTSGNSVRDSSGNLRDGVLTGGAWLTDGQFAGALRLGNNEYVRVDAFPAAQAKFSVSAWVRINSYQQDTTDTGQWGTIVSTEKGNTGGWEVNVGHQQANPSLNFGLWKGPTQGDYDAATCVCLPIGTWTQVAAVVDSAALQLSFYVNGKLLIRSAIAKGILPGSVQLAIGEFPEGSRYLLGDVDEIAVWNRALVAEEVESLYSRPVTDP